MPQAPATSDRSLLLALAAAVALALGVGVLVYKRQQAPPAVVAGDAAASPAPVEASEPATAPSAGAEPSPAAAAGAASGRPPKPASGAPAGGPREKPPLSSQSMARRRFVPSRTAAENVRGAARSPSGFDSRKSREMVAKRAPEVDGRIEFSTSPTRVRPGDGYKVVVSFVNEGKKSVDVRELVVTTTFNGAETSAVVRPLARTVASNQNEVIHELKGTWDRDTTSWGLEVRVTSGRQDVYRNSLAWR